MGGGHCVCWWRLAGRRRGARRHEVTPGELVVDHPTLINLGFEWRIDGDANRNARVEVSYRKQGETPLAGGHAARAPAGRADLPGELVQPRVAEHVRRQHSRSRAGHRLRSALRHDRSRRRHRPGRRRDEDRDRAHASRTEPAAGGRVYHVYPPKWQGAKIEPAFEGIMCAYYYDCGGGDTAPRRHGRA